MHRIESSSNCTTCSQAAHSSGSLFYLFGSCRANYAMKTTSLFLSLYLSLVHLCVFARFNSNAIPFQLIIYGQQRECGSKQIIFVRRMLFSGLILLMLLCFQLREWFFSHSVDWLLAIYYCVHVIVLFHHLLLIFAALWRVAMGERWTMGQIQTSANAIFFTKLSNLKACIINLFTYRPMSFMHQRWNIKQAGSGIQSHRQTSTINCLNFSATYAALAL